MTLEENRKQKLVTIKQFTQKNPWPSEAALRAIIQDAEKRKFRTAFIRYGRRILIDEDEFWACLNRLQDQRS